MFETKVEGPYSVSQQDHSWASALLAEITAAEAAKEGERIFTPLEQQVLRLGLLEGEAPAAAGAKPTLVHRTLDWMYQALFSKRGGRSLANPRLEALRRFTAATRKRRGGVDRQELSSFLMAGFSLQHALEIAICAVATTIGGAELDEAHRLRARLGRSVNRPIMTARGA